MAIFDSNGGGAAFGNPNFNKQGKNAGATQVQATVEITRKTEDKKIETLTQITKVKTTDKTNVLSKYKSYTYRFTLACLSRDQVNDPSSYNKDPATLDLIILRSGGKESGAIKSRGGASAATVAAYDNLLNGSQELDISLEEITRSKKSIETLNQNPELVASFNQNSAGQYDMFIENIQIETIASYTKITNTTLPTTMTFDVIEPYSVNGFLETLGVASRVAGWNNYSEAAYVLVVEFIGYPDGDKITDPVVLTEKRYITIGFNSMEIEITERGTIYKCGAFSWGERGNGIAGKLPSSISIEGSTVGELLSNLVKEFNEQLTKDRLIQYKESSSLAGLHDTFEIRFDSINNTNNTFIKGGDTGNPKDLSIKGSQLYDDNDSKQIALADPQQQTSDAVNYPNFKSQATTYKIDNVVSAGNDKKYTISFKSNTNLRDIIAEIIVNSSYVREKLEDLYEKDGATYLDKKTGMLNYFLIRIETEETSTRDELMNKAVRKYIFVISPYKVHRTRFPNFGKLQQNLSDLEQTSIRSYNYLYTGKNTEILAFKLQYNFMFFEGIPKGSGINDQQSTSVAAASNNSTDPVITGSSVSREKQRNEENSNRGNIVTAAIRTDPNSETSNSQGTAISANYADPYYALSNNLHKALIDPQASMLTAEMDILGDPYFLCTGGIGNQLKTNDSKSTIDDTQAPILLGDLLIDIKFQNPQDIGRDGFMSISKNKTPFHGVYRVWKITNFFKDGVFKQRLDLTKLSGQVLDNTLQAIDTKSNTEGQSNEGGNPTTDSKQTTEENLSSTSNVTNNPPAQPLTTSPAVPLSVDDRRTLFEKGAQGLANATGVNIKQLSADSTTFLNRLSQTSSSPIAKLIKDVASRIL